MSYHKHLSCGNASIRARRLLIAILGFPSLLGWMGASCAADVEVLAQGRGYTEGTIFVGGILYFVDFSSSDVLRVMANRGAVAHPDCSRCRRVSSSRATAAMPLY